MSIKPLIYNRRTADEARELLMTLESPNKLPISAIENAVTSVNGMTGDVVIDGSGGDFQPKSEVLTHLSEMSLTESGMLWQENGDFTVAPVSTFVRSVMGSPNESFFRGMLGLGDSSVLDTNVPFGIPTLDEDGKMSADVIPFDLSAVAVSGSYGDLLDKPVLFSGQYADLTGKPNLFSGDYNDLANKPSIPQSQIQSDWAQADTSSPDFIKNKPIIPTINYPVSSVNGKTGGVVLTNTDVGAAPASHQHGVGDITGLQTALDGKLSVGSSIPYSAITGAPSLSPVAISGSYADITNKPMLFSGSYSDLTNKPSLFDGTWGSLTGKPVLATVATTGNYNDLANKPVIPASQVNSDWNATSGAAQILNKPALFNGTWASLTGKPSFATVSTSGSYADLINKPTIPTSTSQVAEGTNLYYTDARVASYIALNGYRKVETLQGTTNASGVYQVVFGNTYSTPPHVNPVIINGTAAMMMTVSNVTTTGCTVTVQQRSAVTLLAVEVLLAATTPVSGATVAVLVVAK